MRRTARTALFCAVAFAALSAPAYANEDDAWGGGIEVMADDDMGALRGGIAVTPNLNINFGAMITTFVNGRPALSTNLTWTDMGQFVEETVGQIGQRIDDLSPEARDSLGLAGLENVGGVVIQDTDGVTALVHNITEGALQNIVINNATGRDLRQEIDVTLTLPGFESMQNALLLERIGMRIDEDMRGVSFGAN